MNLRAEFNAPSTAGIHPEFAALFQANPLHKLQQSGADFDAFHKDQAQKKSLLHPLDQPLSPLKIAQFGSVCAEAFGGCPQVDPLSVDQGLNFLETSVQPILEGRVPPEVTAFLNKSPLLRQRLETFVKQVRSMQAIEQEIQNALNEGLGKDEATQNALLTALATTLSNRLKQEKNCWIPSFSVNDEGHLEARFCFIDQKGTVSFLDTRNFYQRSLEGLHTDLKVTTKRDAASGASIEEVYISPIAQITSTDKTRLYHPDFFRALLAPRFKKAWNNESGLSGEYFNKSLTAYLKGKFKLQEGKGRPETEKKAQRGSDGLIKGLNSILYFSLCGSLNKGKQSKEGRALYKYLKTQWQLSLFVEAASSLKTPMESLLTYAGKKASDLTEDDYERLVKMVNASGFFPLIQKDEMKQNSSQLYRKIFEESRALCTTLKLVAQNLERSLLKQSGLLAMGVEQRIAVLATLEEVHTLLEKIEHARQKHRHLVAQQIPEAQCVGYFAPIKAIELTTQVNGASKAASALPHEISPTYIGTELEQPLPAFHDADLFLDTISNQLEAFIQANPNPLGGSVQVWMRRVLNAIPVPNGQGGDVWTHYPANKINGLLTKLHRLNDLIRLRGFNSPKKHYPEETLIIYNLLAITDTLVRRLPNQETYLNDFPKLCGYQLYNDINSPEFTLLHGAAHLKMREIVAYYFPDAKELTYFRRSFWEEEKKEILKHTLFALYENQYSPGIQVPVGTSVNADSNATLRYFRTILATQDLQLQAKLRNAGFALNSSDVSEVCGLISKVSREPDFLGAAGSLFKMALKATSLHSLQTYYFLPNMSDAVKLERVNEEREAYLKFELEARITGIKRENLQLKFPFYGLSQGTVASKFSSTYGTTCYINHHYNDLNSLVTHHNGYWGSDKQSPEEYAALMELGINPYRVIAGVTSYLSKHTSQLTREVVQNNLSIYVFNAERMLSQLEDNSEIVIELLKAIQEAITHHFSSFDTSWSAIHFLVAYGLRCQELVRTLGMALPAELPDMRRFAYERVLPATKHAMQRKELFEALLTRYESYSHEEIQADALMQEQLIHDMLLAKGSGCGLVEKKAIPTSLPEKITNKQNVTIDAAVTLSRFSTLYRSCTERLKGATLTEQEKRMFSSVVKCVFPDAPDDFCNWNAPVSQALEVSSPALKIDCLTGVIQRRDGVVVQDIPPKILQAAEFALLCDEFKSAHYDSAKDVWILLPSEIRVRLRDAELPLFFRQTEVNGHVQESIFVPLAELKEQLPPGFYQRLTREKKLLSWLSTETVNGKQKSFITVEIEGKKKFKISMRKLDPTKYCARKAIAVDAPDLVAEDWMHCEENFRAMFPKSSRYVPECWRNWNTGELDSIQLHGLELNFKIRRHDGKLKAYSSKYADYCVIPRASAPLPEGNYESLVLQNQHDVEDLKVLIAMPTNMNQVNQLRQARGLEPVLKEVDWLEYQVLNGELVPSDIKAALFLATRFVSEGDFDAVARLMPQLEKLGRYVGQNDGVNEEAILDGLIQQLFQQQYHRAHALGLALTAMQEENHLKYPKAVGAEPELGCDVDALMERYISYRNCAGNTAEYRLTIDQERRILQMIQGSLRKDVDQAANFGDRIVAQVKLRIIMQLLGSRFNDLYLQKPPGLKERRVTYENFSKFNLNKKEGVSVQSLEATFNPNPGSTSLTQLNPTGVFFKDHFWSYYRMARSGTKAEREELSRLIDLHAYIKVESNQSFRDILLAVLKKPKKFPTLEQIQQKKRAMEMAQPPYSKAAMRARKNWQNCLNSIANHDSHFFSPLTRVIKMIALLVKVLWKLLKLTWRTRHYVKEREIKTALVQAVPRKAIEFNPAQKQGWKAVDVTFDRYFNTFVENTFTWTETQPDRGLPGENLPAGDADDPLLDRKLKEEQKELEKHRTGLKPFRTYQLKAGVDLNAERAKNQAQIAFWKASLKSLSVHLTWQANHVPHGVSSHLADFFKHHGSGQQLSWDELKQLFLKYDLNAYKQKTLLTPEQIQLHVDGMAAYHALLTQVQKLERVDGLLAQFEELQAHGHAATLKGDALVQLIPTTALVQRAYDVAPATFHVLCVEAAAGYLLTEKQYQKKQEMVEANRKHSCTLFQMPTGFGKTTAVNRVSTYEQAYQESHAIYMRQLVMNVLPEPLEESNTQENREHFGQAYGRKIDRLSFDRSSLIMVDSLKHIYEGLKVDLEEGRPVNMRPETIQAIKLHLDLMLEHETSRPGKVPQALEQIDYLIRIRRLIRTFGVANEDEEDQISNPFSSVIYTDGEPITPPRERLNFMKLFFEFVLDPEIEKQLGIRENRQAKVMELHPEVYDNVAERLVAKFIDHYKIAAQDQASFRLFALNKMDGEPKWLASHPKRDDLSMVKGLLAYVFKACLKDQACEKYTFSKKHLRSKNPKEFAVPCENADQPKETDVSPSQFKNLDVALVKTHLLYMHKGLFDFQVRKLMQFLKESSETEALTGVNANLTWANRFFYEQLAPPHLKNKPLKQLTEKDIENLVPLLQHNPQAIFIYIQDIISNQIKIYPDTFESTSIGLLSLFNSSIAFSATPQAPETHDVNTEYHKMEGTTGQVTALIYRDARHPGAFRFVPAGQDAKKYSLEQLATRPELKATIDVAAWHMGNTNEAVAEQLCEEMRQHPDPDFPLVAFFQDENGVIALKDVATGFVRKVGFSGGNPDHRKTMYSQEKSYGSDVKQAIDAVAQLLLNWKTEKSRAGQGAGRMRQWAQKQRLEFLFEDSVARKIFGPNFETNLSLENATKLLVHLLRTEAHNKAEKNQRAQILQMKDALQSVCNDKIIDVPTDSKERQKPAFRKKILNDRGDVSKALYYYKRFRTELCRRESINPYEMYAKLPQDQDPIPYLHSYQKYVTSRSKELDGLTQTDRQLIENMLNLCASRWKDMALPAKIQGGDASLGADCEVLEQLQVQQQVKISPPPPTFIRRRDPSKWDEKTDLFKPKTWAKPVSIDGLIYRLAKAIFRVFIKPISIDIILKNLNNDPHAGRNIIVFSLTGLVALSFKLTVVISVATVGLNLFNIIGLSIIGGSALFYMTARFICHRILPKSNSCPLMYMKDVYKKHLPKKFHGVANLLGSNFLVTNNYYAQIQEWGENEQRPFGSDQKQLRELMIIQEGKKWRFVAIDGDTDHRFVTKKLKAERKRQGEPEKNCKIGIYNLDLGKFVIQGTQAIDVAELEQNEEFKNICTASDMINGEVRFKDHGFFEKAVKKVGNKVVYDFMANYTLKYHRKNREYFPKSPLGRRLTAVH